MSNSSLSTVVSGLVRASVGASIPNSVTDEELDKAVAELILKEAKQKAERYLQYGVQAYLPDPEPDANLPRTNKRFLNAIIRSTDDHNKAVLRAQAEAAEEAREERLEEERRERRARASEADAERIRRLMGGTRRRRDDHNKRNSDRRRRRSRSVESSSNGNERSERPRSDRHRRRGHSRSPQRSEDKGEGSTSSKRHRSSGDDKQSREHRRRKHTHSNSSQTRRTPSPLRSKKRPKHREDSEEVSNHSDREKRKRSKSPSRSSTKVSRRDGVPLASTDSGSSQVVELATAENGPNHLERLQRTPGDTLHLEPGPSRPRSPPRRRKEPASPTLSEEEDIERMRPRRRPRTEKVLVDDRSSPGAVASKMDKYFEASYDPRLDIEPMTVPSVPSTGLIEGAEFEGWEAMLDIIRQRRQDKLDRKRLERQGLIPEKGNSKKIVIQGEMASSSAWKSEGSSMMDIQYNKRGSVREWDMGKQGF